MRGRARRAVSGALAALAALAFLWEAHRIVAQVPFAPFTLADRIVRLTPGGVATYLIDHLHHTAKPLLAAACLLAVIAAGAGAPALTGRSRRTPAAAFAAGVLVAGLLDPIQRSTWGSVAGAVIAGASYAIVLSSIDALAAAEGPAPHPGSELTRRRALGQLAAMLAGGGILAAIAPRFGSRSTARLRGFAVPTRQPRWPPFPDVAGLTPEITSVADHYIVDIDIDAPVIDAASWRLHVGGLVTQPLALGFDELQQHFELTSEYTVLTCISNPVGGPLVGSSLWEGVRLAELLGAAGARADAWGLQVSCADGYSAGIPLAAALHPGSLVAIAQDGQPLSRDHGFPCRIRIPSLYGMLNPKWVTDVTVVDRPYIGYWAAQGWSRTAVVRTESRIDTPRRAVAGRPTWIAGVAWAGVRGISRVEVSTNAGRSWTPAQLRAPLSPWAWTQWAYRWTPPAPGRYTLACRATDRLGVTQEARARPPHPSGASGYPLRMIEATRP